ncbi:MAG TPA: phytanoyl-CoA dioxygenase, partial [Chryseobacterium indologenes]|nr:phytanoyl-CoA dioxygenase [Chryseobacterium indologenes]
MSVKNLELYKSHIDKYGFSVINTVFSDDEVEEIINVLSSIDMSRENFRKSEDLFAIRQFLKEIPDIKDLIFTENLKKVIREIFGEKYFVVKSIYFD